MEYPYLADKETKTTEAGHLIQVTEEEPAEHGFDPRSGKFPNLRALGGSKGWI